MNDENKNTPTKEELQSILRESLVQSLVDEGRKKALSNLHEGGFENKETKTILGSKKTISKIVNNPDEMNSLSDALQNAQEEHLLRVDRQKKQETDLELERIKASIKPQQEQRNKSLSKKRKSNKT